MDFYIRGHSYGVPAEKIKTKFIYETSRFFYI